MISARSSRMECTRIPCPPKPAPGCFRILRPFWKRRDERGWHGRIYQLTVFLHFSTSTSQPTVSRVSCRLGTVNRTHVHASQCTAVHFSSLSSDCNKISQIKNCLRPPATPEAEMRRQNRHPSPDKKQRTAADLSARCRLS
jgi:hypothetical protein